MTGVMSFRREKRDKTKKSRESLTRRFFNSGGLASRFASRVGLPRRLTGHGNENKRTDETCVPQQQTKSVAIIGGGASGLVCARECLREGHEVTVFERSECSGGTWRIDDVFPEIIGMNVTDPAWKEIASTVHSSMYDTVRTIIPRQIMGFTDYPFDTEFPGSTDPRNFCLHDEVRKYLEAFETQFNLTSVIRFNSSVIRVEPFEREETEWEVEVETNGQTNIHHFSAVIVATGHYSTPYVPSIDHMERFGKPCIHSHLYRTTEPLTSKVVVILGNSISGFDLTRDISAVAKEVYLCARRWPAHIDVTETGGIYGNIHYRANVVKCIGRGALELEDSSIITGVDCFIFCTGYLYEYPFIKPEGVITTKNRMVYPLYKHLIHPHYPNLAFATLANMVVPFIFAEHQGKYLARVFSGRCVLPPKHEMMAEIEKSMKDCKKEGRPLEKYHYMQHRHYDYMRELATLCKDVEPVGDWRHQMHNITLAARKAFPDDYKDVELNFWPWNRHAEMEFAAVKSSMLTSIHFILSPPKQHNMHIIQNALIAKNNRKIMILYFEEGV